VPKYFELFPFEKNTEEELNKLLAWQHNHSKAHLSDVHFSIYQRNKQPLRIQGLEYQSHSFCSFEYKVNHHTLFFDSSVTLHPSALFTLATWIKSYPEVDVWYWNEQLKNGYYRKTTFSKFSLFGSTIIGSGICLTPRAMNLLENTNISVDEIATFLSQRLPEKSFRLIPLALNQIDCLPLQIKNLPSPEFEPQKISVITPFRNNIDITINAIKSLSRQTIRDYLEIILIDNNSDSIETLTTYLEKVFPNQYKILRDPDYFNFARLNNLGAINSSHDLLLFLNNDVELCNEDALEYMSHWINSYNEICGVSPVLRYPDGTIQTAGIDLMSVGPANSAHQYAEIFREVYGISFACALIRKQTFFDVKGLDELKCPNGFGDVLFCHEMRSQGGRFIVEPRAQGIHYESKSRGSVPEQIEYTQMIESGIPIARYYDQVSRERVFEVVSNDTVSVFKRILKKILKFIG